MNIFSTFISTKTLFNFNICLDKPLLLGLDLPPLRNPLAVLVPGPQIVGIDLLPLQIQRHLGVLHGSLIGVLQIWPSSS